MQEVHKDLWKGSNRKFSKIPWHKIEVQRHNAERTPEQQVRQSSCSDCDGSGYHDSSICCDVAFDYNQKFVLYISRGSSVLMLS